MTTKCKKQDGLHLPKMMPSQIQEEPQTKGWESFTIYTSSDTGLGGWGVLSWGVDGKCHSRNSVPIHSLLLYQDLQLRGMDREKQAVWARSVGQYCGSALSTRNVYQQCGPTVWASSRCYRMWTGATQKNSLLPTTYQRSKGPSVYVWDL